MRSEVVMIGSRILKGERSASSATVDRAELGTDDVGIPLAYPTERRRFRLAVEMDSREGRMGPVINDILDFFHVDGSSRQDGEHMGQHPGPVPVTNRQHMRGRAPGQA